MKYTVIRDNQEKANRWEFAKTDICQGMIEKHLITGDYTLCGLEDVFIVEKKSSTGEISKNIFDLAFEKELIRMEQFIYPFVICEFTIEDIFRFPFDSGIPQKFWKKLHVNNHVILKRINEFQLKYKTKWIFAGNYGQEVSEDLFKRVLQLVK